jgi:hypothetical protein
MIDIWIRGKHTDPTHKENAQNTNDYIYVSAINAKDTIEDDALVNELHNEAELLCILDA